MARRALLTALQPYRRRSQRAVDALRAVDPDRIGLPISQERTRHTPHLSSTGASRRRAHSDRLSRLLFASNAEAHGGAGKVGRHQNDRCLDSHGGSTLVDSASLHTACSRHEIAHRETEIAAAEPAATAPCGAKTEPRNRGTDRPVGGVCGEDLSLTSTDSKALNPLRGAQLRKFG